MASHQGYGQKSHMEPVQQSKRAKPTLSERTAPQEWLAPSLLQRIVTHPHRMTPTGIQILQRAYGNRAFTHLVPRSSQGPPTASVHSNVVQRLLVLDDKGIDFGLIVDAGKVLETDPGEDAAMLMSQLKSGYKYKKGEKLRLIGHGEEATREFGHQVTKTLIGNLKTAGLLKPAKEVELMSCFLGGGKQTFAKALAKELDKDAMMTAYRDTNVTYKTGESMNLPETKGEEKDYDRIAKAYAGLTSGLSKKYSRSAILGQIKGKTPKEVADDIRKLAKKILQEVDKSGQTIVSFYDELYKHHEKFAWKKRGVESKPASKW